MFDLEKSLSTTAAEFAAAILAKGEPSHLERDLLASLTIKEIRRQIAIHLERGEMLSRITVAPAAISPQTIRIVFEFTCAPGEIKIPLPCVFVELRREDDHLMRIIDPYRLPPEEAYGVIQPQSALPLVLKIDSTASKVIRGDEDMAAINIREEEWTRQHLTSH